MNELEFWNWFEKNQSKFLFLNDIIDQEVKDKLLDELLAQLHLYCHELYFEIGGHPDDEMVEIIITAEGDRDYFEHVERLVNAFPSIKGWEAIAFKPPMGKGFKTNYQGKEFDPSKTIFIPLNHKEKPELVGLQVCYPDFNEEEKDIYFNGTYLMLDTLIGEKSATIDIDYLKVVKTPENIAESDFMHLENIEEHINYKKRNANNG